MDLFVSVKEARNLRDTQLFGTQDPYCTIKVSGHKVKTKVHHKGGVAPRFDASFHIPSVDAMDDFQIEVKNYSVLRKTHIGIYRERLADAIGASIGTHYWFKLVHNKKPPVPGGEICLRLELRTSSSGPPEPPVNGHFEFQQHRNSRQPRDVGLALSANHLRFQSQSERSSSERQVPVSSDVQPPLQYFSLPDHAQWQDRHTAPPEFGGGPPFAPPKDSPPPRDAYPIGKSPKSNHSSGIPRPPQPSSTSQSNSRSNSRDWPQVASGNWSRQGSGESSIGDDGSFVRSTVIVPPRSIPAPNGDGRIVYMGSGQPSGSFSTFPAAPVSNEVASNQVRHVTTSLDEIDWTGYEELQPYHHLYIYPSMVKIIRSLQSDYMKSELAHYGGTLAMVKSLKFPDEKETLVKEIISLSKVDCPKILRFMGFYISPTAGLCCVTENLAGNPPDLRALLGRPKHGLTWSDKLRMAIDVAEALVYMHAQRPIMIHRNIKAASVILGPRREAVLSGFGCCRDRSYDQTMTSGVGEVQWSAPEMLMDGDYAERVDVYSFGVLLVEMDTHEIPFLNEAEAFSRSDFIGMLVTGRLRHRPSATCPPPIRDIVAACVQHDPALRPNMPTVLQMLQAVSLT
ncbi:protein kinase [Achlya hypogyna]|uniref:Protein kinase n=1 Tax=Achlya hypogyna TaxID=1202772 RepID=A0A1V9ZEE9_ACHHY|nr:protein kinase [Achlya hypogyna]